jgi:hypothetical protein
MQRHGTGRAVRKIAGAGKTVIDGIDHVAPTNVIAASPPSTVLRDKPKRVAWFTGIRTVMCRPIRRKDGRQMTSRSCCD